MTRAATHRRLPRFVRPVDDRPPRDRGSRACTPPQLDRIDLALSNVALGKEARRALERRRARRRDPARGARRVRGSASSITDAQLIADIATGYDVVVMGADKWAQVRDPGLVRRRRRRRATPRSPSLPRVLVAPRPGFDVVGAEVLDIDPEHAHVSSTRARSGEHHLVAPDARRRLLVDGNNVVGSRPDGWWRDRAGRDAAGSSPSSRRSRRAPATRSRSCSTADRSPTSPKAIHDGVRVAYARRAGRDAGDDRIVEEIADRRRSRVAHRRHVGSRARANGRATLGARGRGRGRAYSRVGIGTPVTSSSRSARNAFSAIDTRWYWPTVNTRSSSCCTS